MFRSYSAWGIKNLIEFFNRNRNLIFFGKISSGKKSDRIFEKNFFSDTDTIKEMIDSSKKTILYAPSWEWDERELEIATIVKDQLPAGLKLKQDFFTKEG